MGSCPFTEAACPLCCKLSVGTAGEDCPTPSSFCAWKPRELPWQRSCWQLLGMGKASAAGQLCSGTGLSVKSSLCYCTYRQSSLSIAKHGKHKLNLLLAFLAKNKSIFALGIWKNFQYRAKFIKIGCYPLPENILALQKKEICEHKIPAQILKFYKQSNSSLTNIICLIYGIYMFQSSLFYTF